MGDETFEAFGYDKKWPFIEHASIQINGGIHSDTLESIVSLGIEHLDGEVTRCGLSAEEAVEVSELLLRYADEARARRLA